MYGDPDQLRQRLLALIDNAVTYTPPGGRVTLGLRRADGMTEVTVQASGIGISKAPESPGFGGYRRG